MPRPSPMDEPEHPEPPPRSPAAHTEAVAAPPLQAHWLDPEALLSRTQTDWLAESSARVLRVAAARFAIVGELRARVVNDAAMTAAHREFSGLDSTTDVLTFDLSESTNQIDTDLYVCLDEAARRAAELGHPPERELLLYLVHGLLHCLGHDDHDPEAFTVMHALEDELLEAAGIGATFHAEANKPTPSDSHENPVTEPNNQSSTGPTRKADSA